MSLICAPPGDIPSEGAFLPSDDKACGRVLILEENFPWVESKKRSG